MSFACFGLGCDSNSLPVIKKWCIFHWRQLYSGPPVLLRKDANPSNELKTKTRWTSLRVISNTAQLGDENISHVASEIIVVSVQLCSAPTSICWSSPCCALLRLMLAVCPRKHPAFINNITIEIYALQKLKQMRWLCCVLTRIHPHRTPALCTLHFFVHAFLPQEQRLTRDRILSCWMNTCNVLTKWKDHLLWVSEPMAYARSVGDKAHNENKTNLFVSKLITKLPHLLFAVSSGWNQRRASGSFFLFRCNAFSRHANARRISRVIYEAFETRLLPHAGLVRGGRNERHQWHRALIFPPINFAEKHPHLKRRKII